ncbi:hypothetical protein ACLESO_03755 [Pyxidicoccus sp. 3LG]
MSTAQDAPNAKNLPVLPPEELQRLAREGEELRRELEKRVAPMKQVSAGDLKLRLR